MSTWIVFSVMLVYVFIREIMHYRERKDLYDRIMAGSLDNYTGATGNQTPPKAVENIIKKNMIAQKEMR